MPAEPAPRKSRSSSPAHPLQPRHLLHSLHEFLPLRSLRSACANAGGFELIPLLAVNVGLWLIHDLAHPLALILLGAAFVWLPFAVRRLESFRQPTRRALLVGATLLRLPLLPLPPTLSDDVLRYVWDGRVAAAGHNPYALVPASAALAPLRDETWQRLPHRDVETVYPPLALSAFSIASRFPRPQLAWKLLATGADLLACALLLALAARLGLPLGRTAWYAWNPLAAIEIAGMGHVDSLGVAATIGVVLCLVAAPAGRRSVGAAASWAAAGALAKLVPLVAFPLWARRSGRPWAFIAVALGLVTVAFLPVLSATGGFPPGLRKYGVSWEFNGPLYEPLWRGLDRLGAAPFLARLVDRIKVWTGDYQSWNVIYPYLYPQLLAKALLVLGVGGAVLLSSRERDPLAGTERLFGIALLLSATVYPWYLLWVLPFAALRRSFAWLALSALILLSYIPQQTQIPLLPWVFLAIWAPFFLLLLLQSLQERRA